MKRNEVLLKEAEKWAHENAISRLEANVTANNAIAIHLLNQLNYVQEGTRSQAVKIEDHFVDEIRYSKLLV